MTRREEERLEIELAREQIRLLKEIHDLLCSIAYRAKQIVALLSPFATTAELGGTMSIQSGGTTPVTLTFVDASGATQSPPTGDGSGLEVTISTDNAVVTVDTPTASGDTYVATATAGDVTTDTPFNYTAVVANTSGAALLDNDGVTAFVQPVALASSVLAPVTPPAQATTAVLSEG